MRNTWGVMAGLGVAGLLVAAPVLAQSGTAGSSPSGTDSSPSYGQPGTSHGSDTGTQGQPSTQSPGTSSDTSSGSSMAGATSQNEVSGKVEKFDKSKKELSLRMKVSDSAQVMKDGKVASLADIRPGDEVRASFSGSGDTLEVNRIDVISPSAGSRSYGSPDSSPSSTGNPSGSSKSGSGY